MGNSSQFIFEDQNFPVYVAEPTNGEIKGGVIVVHEVWGLSDHIKSVVDRFAGEGYLALAPDLLSETDIAKYAGSLQADLFNPQKRNEAQPKLRALMTPIHEPGFSEKTNGKLAVCFDYLYNLPAVNRKVVVNGFCFGGSYSYSLATHEPRLKAAVPFYGHASTDTEELRRITCPILAFYGEKDEGLMKDLPELKERMQQASVDFTAVVYPGCGHAFFNDTNSFAYNKEAAADAWKQALDFLEKTFRYNKLETQS
jgi:carboxymethylenebutenolidase